jgi:hypothetical protein
MSVTSTIDHNCIGQQTIIGAHRSDRQHRGNQAEGKYANGTFDFHFWGYAHAEGFSSPA